MNKWLLLLVVLFFTPLACDAGRQPPFRVIAFFTGKSDEAHISFVKEANAWFIDQQRGGGYRYDTTSNWNNLNDTFLAGYQVVLFLDSRPEQPGQRDAFRRYMEKGGGWIGFHFAAFALAGSAFPDNWDWYHQQFLASGDYVSNTWRPTSAILNVEDSSLFNLHHTPRSFRAAPNEWYRWTNDLRKNDSIRILLSIDSSSFPLGTGPKKHEIWTEGYYPVAWSNRFYNMVYFNMGHNDIDYEGGTNRTLSRTFESRPQADFILNTLIAIGHKSLPH